MQQPGTETVHPPPWREDFPINQGEDAYITRRQFAKFLTLTSFGFFVGNVWLALVTMLRRRRAPVPPMWVAAIADMPPGAARVFHYPRDIDACLLIHSPRYGFVAYSQKCTHLACPVLYHPEQDEIRCPCHEGLFDVANGDVLVGPPNRPLPHIRLAVRDGSLYVVGTEAP
ncbi:MAG: ubiquinol-cytochrome c reductase iron-sulfur subunit [Armatimonadetes bacterium]|nr:ubiquinol-cytochrome c reductase iron-sulfur subunit [Armatimonadota bacterium]